MHALLANAVKLVITNRFVFVGDVLQATEFVFCVYAQQMAVHSAVEGGALREFAHKTFRPTPFLVMMLMTAMPFASYLAEGLVMMTTDLIRFTGMDIISS